jgi:hypothetical protein
MAQSNLTTEELKKYKEYELGWKSWLGYFVAAGGTVSTLSVFSAYFAGANFKVITLDEVKTYNIKDYPIGIKGRGRLSSVQEKAIEDLNVEMPTYAKFQTFQTDFTKVYDDLKKQYGSNFINKHFAFSTVDGKGVEFYTLKEIDGFIDKGDISTLSRILKGNATTAPYNVIDSNFVDGFKNQLRLSDGDVYSLAEKANGDLVFDGVANSYTQSVSKIFLIRDTNGLLQFRLIDQMAQNDFLRVVDQNLNNVYDDPEKLKLATDWQRAVSREDLLAVLQKKYAGEGYLNVSNQANTSLDRKSPYDILTANPGMTNGIAVNKYNQYLSLMFSGNTPIVPITTQTDFNNLCNFLRFRNGSDITFTNYISSSSVFTATFKDTAGNTTGRITWDSATKKVTGVGDSFDATKTTGTGASLQYTDTGFTAVDYTAYTTSTTLSTSPFSKLNGFNEYASSFSLNTTNVTDFTSTSANFGKLDDGTIGIRLLAPSKNILTLEQIMNYQSFPSGIKDWNDYNALIDRMFGGANPLVKLDSVDKLKKFAQFLSDRSGLGVDTPSTESVALNGYKLLPTEASPTSIAFTNSQGNVVGKLSVSGSSPYQITGLNAEYAAASSTVTEKMGLKLSTFQTASEIQGAKTVSGIDKLKVDGKLKDFVSGDMDPAKKVIENKLQNVNLIIAVVLGVAAFLALCCFVHWAKKLGQRPEKNRDIDAINNVDLQVDISQGNALFDAFNNNNIKPLLQAKGVTFDSNTIKFNDTGLKNGVYINNDDNKKEIKRQLIREVLR